MSPERSPADLLASIVSYRAPELLAACLAAVERERAGSGLAIEVTVVDNASNDASGDLVRARFPWATLIANPENVGFGRAHNQALRGARARHLLVLNADTEVQPGSLRTLVEYLDQHPDVAVAGPRLRYPDGRVQPSRRRFPTFGTFFVESTQIGQRFVPTHPLLGHFRMDDRSDDEEQDVDWLVGACLCVRARAAAEVGLFDERFFLYSEEMDWCRRFKAAGWRVVYLPTADVLHVEGGSSRTDLAARERQFQASRLAYVEKWHGAGAARFLQGYLLAETGLRIAEERAKASLGSRANERAERLRVLTGTLAMLARWRPDGAIQR